MTKVIDHLKTLIQNPDVKLEPTKPDVDTWPSFEPKPFKLSTDIPYKKGDKVCFLKQKKF
jgi:hypothetical protein